MLQGILALATVRVSSGTTEIRTLNQSVFRSGARNDESPPPCEGWRACERSREAQRWIIFGVRRKWSVRIPLDLARPELGPPRSLNPPDRRRITRLAGSHDLHHVRRPAVSAGELTGLLDPEHLPVGFDGVGRRQDGGRNRLSPPAGYQRGAADSRAQHLG